MASPARGKSPCVLRSLGEIALSNEEKQIINIQLGVISLQWLLGEFISLRKADWTWRSISQWVDSQPCTKGIAAARYLEARYATVHVRRTAAGLRSCHPEAGLPSLPEQCWAQLPLISSVPQSRTGIIRCSSSSAVLVQAKPQQGN